MQIDRKNHVLFLGDIASSFPEWLNQRQYSSTIVLVDENTSKACLPIFNSCCPLPFEVIMITSGENHKNLDSCSAIWSGLMNLEADRHALFVNLGGGVITDMGGFAAATYKRGIDFVHIPTTLLAQVDATLGGKLGVDFRNAKNQVGLFLDPKAIFIDTQFLNTLPDRQMSNGKAEMIKHGLIADQEFFKELMESADQEPSLEMIHRSLQIKMAIVDDDPLENGPRKKLNFGHTVGHAIESHSLETHDEPLLHGESIWLGMVVEAHLSMQLNLLQKDDYDQVRLDLLNLAPRMIRASEIPAIIKWMKHDKKNTDGQINFTLLNGIGSCSINHHCSLDQIESALKEVVAE